jgi:anti-anti-sigma regulatory factor
MQYKIEPKEKFTVIKILDTNLGSNLVPELSTLTQEIMGKAPKSLIMDLSAATNWDLSVIEFMGQSQQAFYDNNASFVICCLSDGLQEQLDASDYAEMLNMTPTESEAWDIVQMEEIERELLDSDDMEFNEQD